MSLQKRVALVTGAGRGIGLITARVLCERGMAVAVNDRDAEAAERAAAGLRDAGHRAIAWPADVTRAEEVSAMFAHVGAALGPLWLLVNNAGTHHRRQPQSSRNNSGIRNSTLMPRQSFCVRRPPSAE
jgi:NAD(P)-dependent dehydrogenase (short-subunit alcohol dehydrogenase family)